MAKSKRLPISPDKSTVIDSSAKLEEIKSILQSVPEEEKLEIIQFMAMSVETNHSGPLPAPETLARYNEIIENGAERIMSMAENQSSSRIQLENTAVRRQLNQSSLGQIFGLLIALVALGISWHMTINGHDWVAGIIGGTTVIGLVSTFVIGKKRQKKDLEDKDV